MWKSTFLNHYKLIKRAILTQEVLPEKSFYIAQTHHPPLEYFPLIWVFNEHNVPFPLLPYHHTEGMLSSWVNWQRIILQIPFFLRTEKSRLMQIRCMLCFYSLPSHFIRTGQFTNNMPYSWKKCCGLFQRTKTVNIVGVSTCQMECQLTFHWRLLPQVYAYLGMGTHSSKPSTRQIKQINFIHVTGDQLSSGMPVGLNRDINKSLSNVISIRKEINYTPLCGSLCRQQF